MSPGCTGGFSWHGQPAGHETIVASLSTYVSGSGAPDSPAVLIVSDVFGWTLPNARLLADHFAREANLTAYLPDFFDGEVLDPNALYSGQVDLMDFVGRHSKEIRGPQMFELARELKTRHPKVGAVGYCYGGWAVFQLGAKDNHLVDCISTAHPSFLTTREIEDSGVPVQIIAPENDHQLTPELREFCNKTIPTLGLPYAYDFFPGLGHGFAIRGDPSDPVQKKGLERAKSAVVYWLGQHLH